MILIDMFFRVIFIILMLKVFISLLPYSRDNQIVSLINRLTEPFLQPVRAMLPPTQTSIDLAPLLLLLFIYLLKNIILSLITGLTNPFLLVFDFLYFSILARVALSWIPHNRFNPIIDFVYRATEPILKPFREIIPPTLGGIDLSPILAIIVLNIIQGFFI